MRYLHKGFFTNNLHQGWTNYPRAKSCPPLVSGTQPCLSVLVSSVATMAELSGSDKDPVTH